MGGDRGRAAAAALEWTPGGAQRPVAEHQRISAQRSAQAGWGDGGHGPTPPCQIVSLGGAWPAWVRKKLWRLVTTLVYYAIRLESLLISSRIVTFSSSLSFHASDSVKP